jgi:hypothetical protein
MAMPGQILIWRGTAGAEIKRLVMLARRLRRAFTRNATSASPPGLSVGQRLVYRMLAEQTILPLPLTVTTCEYDGFPPDILTFMPSG